MNDVTVQNNKQINSRNSLIELLRIFAMFLIVLSHSLSLTAGDVNYTGMQLSQYGVLGLVYHVISNGQVGNAIFIAISCFFLVGSEKIKIRKAVLLIINEFLISSAFLIFFICTRHNLQTKEIYTSLLPFTYNIYWFVTCYVIFYLVHPLLTFAFKKLKPAIFLAMNVVIFLAYCIVQFFLVGHYYYTFLVGFIVYFSIISYLKMYHNSLIENKKFLLIFLISAFCVCVFVDIGVVLLSQKIGLFATIAKQWTAFINPFIMCIAIPLVFLVSKSNFKSKFIDVISSTMFLVYLLHENHLYRNYIQINIHSWIGEHFTSFTYLYFLCYSLLLFVVCVLIALIYKFTVEKLLIFILNKTSNPVYSFFSKIFNKCTNKTETEERL